MFNDPLTPQREVAFASMPQTDVQAISHAFKVSVDEVFLTACTLSLRAWLQRHARVPEHPLLMQVLFSSSPARIRLPVQHSDPARILVEVQAERQRDKPWEFPAFAELVPPNLLHTGMRLYTGLELSRWLGPFAHGVAATIDGPPVPVYCAGAPVIRIHAVPPLLEGAGLTITQVLHGQAIDASVCVCPDRVTAVEEIADGIVYGVMQMRAQRKKRNRRRR
jgi:diacylglycerol O-acyltransferase